MADFEYNYDAIPARVLNVSSRNLLSKMLNPQMEIATSKHICKDYRGLAELMNFDYCTIRSFEATGNPTKKIFEEWEVLPNSTIGKFKLLLEEIERYDVIEDMQHLIEQDVRSYLARNQTFQEAPLQVAEISSGPKELCEFYDSNILTVDDISIRQKTNDSEVAYFDAYVCFAEEDAEFVYMLAEYLESPEIGMKLCIKDRNLMPGINVYEAIVKIINERCNCMLIILSPEFLRSEECKFQARYAKGLAISKMKRTLIPLMYKPCQTLSLIQFDSMLDFTKAFVFNWAWKKLLVSIKNTVNTDVLPLPSPSFCAPLYMALQNACSGNSYSYPLTLPAPYQSTTRSTSPQPSISFPPSSTYFLPSISSITSITVASTSSCNQSTANSLHSASSSVQSVASSTNSSASSVQSTVISNQSTASKKSKWARFVEKFSSSSTNSDSSGNTSSGFQSQSGSNVIFSEEFVEEI